MKYFKAIVLTKGKKEEHNFYANDRKHASELTKLKYSGIVIKITEEEEPLDLKLKKFKDNLFKNLKKKKIKPDSQIASIRQLAVMTNAGISIYDSLNEIATSTNDETLKLIFSKLAEDINSGQALSKSMEQFRFELGNLTIAMVQLGEKTGNIDESLYSLADMLEEIRANVVKFKKAMAYPRNVMIAIAIAFVVLISFVVPNFRDMFEKLNTELPLPTLILLKLEYLFNNYGIYVLAALFTTFIVFKYLINNFKNIKYAWHRTLLKTYLIKNIIMYATLSRFTLVFSELIRAGIPIAEALDTSIAMVDNLPLQDKLLSVRVAVETGLSLNKGLEDTKLFENMVVQMVSAGEDSGTLDTMIKKVAEYYKMKFDAIIDGLSEAIEPVMLLIIAAMVTLLALGIFMPMWSLGEAAIK